MTASRSLSRWFAVAVLASWVTLADTTTKKELIDSATVAYQLFSAAQIDQHWDAVGRSIYAGELSAQASEKAIEAFIAHAKRDRAAGLYLKHEQVLTSDLYSEGGAHVVFLKVRSVYAHPISGELDIAAQLRYGFSTDGKHWRFNVASCFSAEHLKRMFPHYMNKPPFE
jgi:predicted ester cyclase